MSDTVKTVLKSTKDILKNSGDETWSIDSDLLVMEAIGLDRMQLVTHDDDFVSAEQKERLEAMLKRRLEHEPMQYILGRCEFMGLEYKVNKNVLIPRPDTEVLVEEVLKHSPESALDIGTGSGAVAVALAKYGVKAVTACDISDTALETAKKNAELNSVDVKFIKSDLFGNINGVFEAVVSNPPYIAKDVIPTLASQVKDFEPHLALDGGDDGLDFYKKITSKAKEYLVPNGLLAFEIGYDQGEAVCKLLAENGFDDIKLVKDLAGLDRVVTGKVKQKGAR